MCYMPFPMLKERIFVVPHRALKQQDAALGIGAGYRVARIARPEDQRDEGNAQKTNIRNMNRNNLF